MRLLPLAVAFVALSARLAAAAVTAANTPEIVIDRMWSTTYDSSKIQELSNPKIAFVSGSALTASVNVTASDSAKTSKHDLIGINIQDNQVHQLVDAFGGGITDSVAITLQDFKTKHPKDYNDLLHLMFSQDPSWWSRGGVGLNAVRVPLGACDFGVSPYTYDDTEDGSEDMALELFTIKKAPKLWQTLHDIVAINPALKIVVAPWSAPGWMKEGANADQPLFGGSLKSGMEEVFAKYLIRSVVEIQREERLNVYAMSLLNEPQIPELKYPTMKLSATQAVKVGRLVRNGLNQAGFKSTKLLTWDFNWDNTQYPLSVLDADPTIWDGVAWHGYAGKPSDQEVVHDAYPDKDAYFTEHTTVTQYGSEPYINMKNEARNLLIGSIRYSSRSVILWNLVLRKDEDGFTTPHLPNICMNCNAAVLLMPESTDANLASSDPNHTQTLAEASIGATTPEKQSKRKRSLLRRSDKVDLSTNTLQITPRTPATGLGEAVLASKVVDAKRTGSDTIYSSDLFKRSSDFSVLSHLSAAVRPTGVSKSYSKRIGVTSTDETTELGGRLLAQAFRQDGVRPGITRFSLVLLNQNDHYDTGVFEEATAVIGFRGMVANVTTVPGLYTLSWEAPTVASIATDEVGSVAPDAKDATAPAAAPAGKEDEKSTTSDTQDKRDASAAAGEGDKVTPAPDAKGATTPAVKNEKRVPATPEAVTELAKDVAAQKPSVGGDVKKHVDEATTAPGAAGEVPPVRPDTAGAAEASKKDTLAAPAPVPAAVA